MAIVELPMESGLGMIGEIGEKFLKKNVCIEGHPSVITTPATQENQDWLNGLKRPRVLGE